MKESQNIVIEPRWMTADEVARYLGLSRATIYEYVSSRKIPFVKVPKSNQVRFDRGQIDEWMLRGAVLTIEEALKGGEQNGNASQAN